MHVKFIYSFASFRRNAENNNIDFVAFIVYIVHCKKNIFLTM